MEIEQVAEMARAVAALPQAARDFFDGMVAEQSAMAAEAERIAKLRKLSDLDAVQFAVMELSDTWGFNDAPRRLLQALREAGFVRADLQLLRDAQKSLEAMVKLIADMAPRLVDPPQYPEMERLNDLIMRAATSLSRTEAGRP